MMSVISSRKKTELIRQALRLRSKNKGQLLLEEVKNQIGYNKQVRYADAIQINLYPSSGQEITGYEIKVSRADLIKELRQPNKANAIMDYCNYWYLVLDKNVSLQGIHLPDVWGVIEWDSIYGNREGSLTNRKFAAKLTPRPVDKDFMFSCLRASRKTALNEIQERIDEIRRGE